MKRILLRFTLCIALLFVSTFSLVFAEGAPYNKSKYRPVLDDSKLQAPTSSPAAVNQGDFAGFSDEYFQLDSSGKYMTFEMDGSHNRSELRQMEEWYTSTSTWRKIIGEVKVFYPTTSNLNQFTFMQAHDSEAFNKPLIRLAWIRSRQGSNDHLWAIVRLSSETNSFQYVNLGKRPNSFFKCEIKIKNNKMVVRINNETRFQLDVDYWESLSSYYKAGVYLQSEGSAKVQFRKLKYYYN